MYGLTTGSHRPRGQEKVKTAANPRPRQHHGLTWALQLTGQGQPADGVAVGEAEAQPPGVVVDHFRAVERQGEEGGPAAEDAGRRRRRVCSRVGDEELARDADGDARGCQGG